MYNPQVSMNYGITSIPAILFIKNGQVVDKLVGAQPKGNFVKKIEAHILKLFQKIIPNVYDATDWDFTLAAFFNVDVIATVSPSCISPVLAIMFMFKENGKKTA